jgi:hypothetical protein
MELVEGEYLGCSDIPSVRLEAGHLVIVASKFREVSNHQIAAWLYGVDLAG